MKNRWRLTGQAVWQRRLSRSQRAQFEVEVLSGRTLFEKVISLVLRGVMERPCSFDHETMLSSSSWRGRVASEELHIRCPNKDDRNIIVFN